MSLRNLPPRKPPAGPSGPESECMLLPLVARMAVDRPEGLGREPWASHLRTCAICYEEAAGYTRSAAVFQAIEGSELASQASTLTWESFQSVLEQQRAAAERARSRARWAIPLAATAAGVLAVTGVLGWDGLQGDTTAPARIVQVLPHEQRSMEDLVRWTLESEGRHTDRLLTGSHAPDRPGGLNAELPPLILPDADEFAANVSPQDADRLTVERVSTATGRDLPISGTIERRLPPTQPASDRFGPTLPPLRLEHRLVPTQPVSFPVRD